MCLGVPGKIIEVYQDSGMHMAKVDFGGVIREVCVEALPEIQPGEWTIIHAGFALSILSEEEAQATLDCLREIELLNDALDLPAPSAQG